jgi:hypothetical protein
LADRKVRERPYLRLDLPYEVGRHGGSPLPRHGFMVLSTQINQARSRDEHDDQHQRREQPSEGIFNGRSHHCAPFTACT